MDAGRGAVGVVAQGRQRFPFGGVRGPVGHQLDQPRRRAGDRVVAEQGLEEADRLAVPAADVLGTRCAQCLDDLAHLVRAVLRVDAERVADLVRQAAPLQVQRHVPRVLRRAGAVQAGRFEQACREGVVAVPGGVRRGRG